MSVSNGDDYSHYLFHLGMVNVLTYHLLSYHRTLSFSVGLTLSSIFAMSDCVLSLLCFVAGVLLFINSYYMDKGPLNGRMCVLYGQKFTALTKATQQ